MKYMIKETVYDTKTRTGLDTVGFIYENFLAVPYDDYSDSKGEKSDIYFISFETKKEMKTYLKQMKEDARIEKHQIQIKDRFHLGL